MPLTRIQTDAIKDAITTSNILDGTILPADLSTGRPAWDSSGNLNVTSPAFTDSIATINSTSTNVSQRLNFTANGTIQTQIYDDSAETRINAVTSKPLTFRTANTEKMRINSAGDLKFGTASSTASASVQAEFKRAGNSYTLQLTNDESGNGPGNNMRLVQGFNSYIQASNGFYLDPTGVLGVTKGITFPATQVASADANTLDDYEEGTWTPQFTAATSGAPILDAYSASYVKIGRLVTLILYASVRKSTAVGYLNILGLPFTVESGYYPQCALLTDYCAAQYVNPIVQFSSNEAKCYVLIGNGSTTAHDQAQYSLWSANAFTIRFSATYRTTS
jgi:hypothetical protein